MPYQFDPMAGLLPPAPGAGVMAPPGPVAPVAPIQPPLGMGVESANAKERLKRNALEQAIFKIMALREQPLFARGAGPLGIQIGQGPGGWATAIGSAVAGVLGKKALDEATAKAMGLQGPLAEAENETNAAINAARRQQFIPQGTPLSLSDQ